MSRLTIYFKMHSYEKETWMFKILIISCKSTSASLNKRLGCYLINISALFFNRCVYGNAFSLMLRQKTLCRPTSSTSGFWLASTQRNYALLRQMWHVEYMLIRVYPNTSKIIMFGKEYGYADTKDLIKVWTTYWTIGITHYIMTSELAGRHAIIQIALGEASLIWQLKMVFDSAKHSLANSLQRNGSTTVAVRYQ